MIWLFEALSLWLNFAGSKAAVSAYAELSVQNGLSHLKNRFAGRTCVKTGKIH